MAARKLPKRLFKNKDVVHTYQHDRENKLDMKTLSRDHLDVLQNIEFALVRAAREDDAIDDRAVDEALRLALGGGETDDTDPLAQGLSDLLDSIRGMRPDVPDNVWNGSLKVVRDSVRRHSNLAPGQKSYLRFVAPYVR